MEKEDGEKSLFNVTLAKCVGLYQILDPETTKIRGYNAYHVGMVALAVYGSFVSIVLCANGWHSWSYDTTASVMYFAIAQNGLYQVYKVLTVVGRCAQVSRCLQITRFDFQSSRGRRGGRLLESGRARSVLFTNWFAFLGFIGVVCYVSCPLLFYGNFVAVLHRDGSTAGDYRLNIVNAYLPTTMMSADTYNRYFYAFYATEVVYIVFYALFLFVFDVLSITLCTAMACQLQITCESFKSLGHHDDRLAHSSGTYNIYY